MGKVYVQPLAWERDFEVVPRINLVVDSLENEYVFGGVATTVIFATLLSRTTGIPLRIITRTNHSGAHEAYYSFLKSVHIDPASMVTFFNAQPGGQYNDPLPVSARDIFFATSWWSSHVVSLLTDEPFFHIIQEDETVFYTHGDHQVFCEQVLAHPNARYIVNSKILFDYFATSPFEQVKNNSVYFEPAFPKTLFSPGVDSFTEKHKRTFFFYARPGTDRNLYYAGVRLIESAIEQGILDTNRWEICFGGESFTPLPFSNGVVPRMLGKLNWTEYTNFLKRVDVGMSLLWSPHPGYIPFDVVASGGVSLSNTYRAKNVSTYSDNIVCGDIINTGFVSNEFKRAIDIAENTEQRKKNFDATHLVQDWTNTFANSFDYVLTELKRRNLVNDYGTCKSTP